MSIEDHRFWVERNIGLLPPAPVKTETVARAVARVARALGQAEQQLVDALVADCKYTPPERERVEEWAREAITLAASTVDGAAWNGTILSDNAFFQPLAARFSPTYVEALERTYARSPSEMKAITLMRAREDIKSAGLRLQQIYEKALAAAIATGWYEVVNTGRGRRVRPLKDEALADKRADVGLTDRDEANARILRAGDPPRQIARAIESYDPFVLVADAHVTGEVAYEPIRSGLRSLGVIRILDDTRLVLNISAARAERDRLKALLAEHEAKVRAGVQQRERIVRVTATTTQWRRGSREKTIRTVVTQNGVQVVDNTLTLLLKHPAPETRTARRKSKKTTWSKPWTSEEYGLVKDKLSVEQQYYAMETVLADLESENSDETVIKTQMRQGINRRWNATSFWLEALAGDSSTVVEPEQPATIDPETGEEEEGVTQRVRTARGRLFGVLQRGGGRRYPRETLAGVDVSSSQWQIYSILLNDTVLESNLALRSAAEIAGPKVWPGDPDAVVRAKQILVAGGYGSRPDRIEWKTHIPQQAVRRVLTTLGDSFERFLNYTLAIAKAVDSAKGFRFIDPFDGVEVVWHPVKFKQVSVSSDKVQLSTYLAQGLDRPRLARQLAPMLIHTLDSAFSGLVIEGLHQRGVKDIIALFDCWLVPQRQTSMLDEVIADRSDTSASAQWLRMLGNIYDALLAYDIPDREWMETLKAAWQRRADAKTWPKFRTKPVRPVSWMTDEGGQSTA
jgi:hypothetical protein